MADRDITFEMLSAHADGALSSEDAARVGRAVATDPELAARLSVLLSLRAGVAGLADQPMPAALTGRMAQALDQGRRRNGWRARAAVVAALAMTMGAALWLHAGLGGRAQPMPVIAQQDRPAVATLIAAYDRWGDAAPKDASLAQGDVPRLSLLVQAAGLERDFTTRFALPDGTEVLHTGYLGHLGCRLSLFETSAAAGQPQALSISISSDLALASWATQDRSYLVVARHMDVVRFTTISSVLNAATAAPVQDEDGMIAMMSGVHQHCLA